MPIPYQPNPDAEYEAFAERLARATGGPELVAERRNAKLAVAFAASEAERAAKVKAWREADEKERKERERRNEADRAARTEAAAVELKSRMRFNYLQTPGSTEAGFEKTWPRLLEEHQVRETLAATHGTLSEQIFQE